MKFIALLFTVFISLQTFGQEKFPDGTPIPDWFRQNNIVNIETLGGKYQITDYGAVNDSTLLQTEKYKRSLTWLPKREVVSLLSPKVPSSAVLFSSNREHIYI